MLNRPTTEERVGKRSMQTVVRYFSLFMAVVYIGLGIFLFFTSPDVLSLSPTVQRALGGVFVLYGLIRLVRTYQQYFKKPHDISAR
jgi:hypothetical protein